MAMNLKFEIPYCMRGVVLKSDLESTIIEVKKTVEDFCLIPIRDQILKCNGVDLQDQENCASYGITEDSIIIVNDLRGDLRFPPDQKEVSITVELSESSWTLHIKNFQTVFNVKVKVEELSGIPAMNQILVFKKTPLENMHRLLSHGYGLTAGSVIKCFDTQTVPFPLGDSAPHPGPDLLDGPPPPNKNPVVRVIFLGEEDLMSDPVPISVDDDEIGFNLKQKIKKIFSIPVLFQILIFRKMQLQHEDKLGFFGVTDGSYVYVLDSRVPPAALSTDKSQRAAPPSSSGPLAPPGDGLEFTKFVEDNPALSPLLAESAALYESLTLGQKQGTFASRPDPDFLYGVISPLSGKAVLEDAPAISKSQDIVVLDKPTMKLEEFLKNPVGNFLRNMGVEIYGLEEETPRNELSWDNMPYPACLKGEIKDKILLPLQRPEVYDAIAPGKRLKFARNRAQAVLFKGPQGTGKTYSARLIANEAAVPVLYVPPESLMPKFNDKIEQLLMELFTVAKEFPNGAIIFLDEVDRYAGVCDSEKCGALKISSELSSRIRDIEQVKKVMVIAATNREHDLNPILSRKFDTISFHLPDELNCQEIAALYAPHLLANELAQFAVSTKGMSGGEIKEICMETEAARARRIIGGGGPLSCPCLEEYIEEINKRRNPGRPDEETPGV